jgi:hypothetical protein
MGDCFAALQRRNILLFWQEGPKEAEEREPKETKEDAQTLPLPFFAFLCFFRLWQFWLRPKAVGGPGAWRRGRGRGEGPEFNAFGGPNLIHLPTGHWLAAGRRHQDGAHTARCYLDMAEHKMTKLLKFPSGGDTSCPGLVWHNDLLYLSYYSTHEGKTSIYLAKIKVM